jgi:hypothetical protein
LPSEGIPIRRTAQPFTPIIYRLDDGMGVAPTHRMRLIDTLAARRALYSRPMATCPDVMVLDIPSHFASADLPLGRFYPIIIETVEEARELSHFLDCDQPTLISPDLLDRRPSAFMAHDIAFCRYEPPVVGWPWLLLCHWPPIITKMVAPGSDAFARGAYTTELFATALELEIMQVRLVEQLGSQDSISVRFISNATSGTA